MCPNQRRYIEEVLCSNFAEIQLLEKQDNSISDNSIQEEKRRKQRMKRILSLLAFLKKGSEVKSNVSSM